MLSCESCGSAPAVARISQWAAVTGSDGRMSPRNTRRLCAACTAWLCRVLGISPEPVPPGLHGMPTTGGRRLYVADQCRLCRLRVDSDGAIVAVDLALTPPLRHTALVCSHCRTWLSSITSDLRSVRGLAARSIDGPYGGIPHGWVSPLTVGVDIDDAPTSELVVDVATRMGASVVENAEGAGGMCDVRFITVGDDGALPEPSWPGERTVAVVPHLRRGALDQLAGRLRTDWVTAPATPQQVAHVLLRAFRYPDGLPRDPGTALPVVHEPALRGPVLVALVPRTRDRQSVAWQLRRYARGYDEVVAGVDGRILVIPRCEPEQVERMARRLEPLLEGAARLLPGEAQHRPRLDLSG